MSFVAGKLARTVVTGENSTPRVEVWSGLSEGAKYETSAAALEQEGRALAWARSVSTPKVRLPETSLTEPRENWAARSAETPEHCLDLTSIYNGHLETGWEPFYYLWDIDAHLAELPRGVVTLDGVQWDVRGLAVVGKGSSRPLETWRARPENARVGIVKKIGRFHFLHAFGMGGDEGVIARYQIKYVDGRTHIFPLRSGVEIAHWWEGTAWSNATAAKVAWEGTHPRSIRAGVKARLYHWSAENPYPEVEVADLVFEAESLKCTAMLVAVTVE